MRDHEFEWDDRKSASNLRKHNVSFETARLAFSDPAWFEPPDPDPDEDRWQRICMHDSVLYVVIYVERRYRNRIISARKANQYEQGLYQNR